MVVQVESADWLGGLIIAMEIRRFAIGEAAFEAIKFASECRGGE